jgi:hypothetical protein
MDTWGDLVRRQAAGGTTNGDTRRQMSSLVITLVVDPVSDAARVVPTVAEMLEAAQGGRPATGWMRRAAQRMAQRVTASPHGAPRFDGGTCCYEHLRGFEGRADLRLPFETTCPGCSAVYRIRLGTIRR